MPRDFDEVLDQFVEENRLYQMDDKAITKIVEAIGYDGDAFGRPIENFLQDNPGACQALYNWISRQGISDWQDQLEAKVEPRDEEEDEEQD